MLRNGLILGVLAAGGLLAWHGTGHAEFIKRDMLVQACTAHDQAKLNDCEGYILGVADTAMGIPGSDGKPGVCIDKIAGKALRLEVVSYLQAHPSSSPSGAGAVLEALRSLHKCG